MPPDSVCAEIGVWLGDFSAQILDVVRPTKLHPIDPWRFFEEEPYAEAYYGGRVAKSQEDMDRIYRGVADRFERERARGIVELHRAESATIAPSFADEYFDWIYIDGNHLYDYVRRDLESFLLKVKRGGYIAGDDYGTYGWWKGGVKRAVDEFVAEGRCDLVSLRHNQFVLRRP